MIQEPLPPDALQALLAAIVESSDDAIVSKNLNSIVTSWNPAAERIFGYTAAEMVGQSITRIIPPDRPNEETEILARIGRGERVDHFETERVRKDGTRIQVSVTISPVRNAAGQIVGASKIARDITEQKRLEAQLREHADQLQLYSEQIQAQNEELQLQNEEILVQNEGLAEADRQKNRFLAMLAHELRHPLGPVVNAAQLLRLRCDDADSRRYTAIIDRQVRHMGRLLDDLLEISRITHGVIELREEVLDLGLLVYSVAQDLDDYLQERRHELTLKVPPVPLPVKGDPMRLAQVVTNLLNNAAKFTPPGGEIRLSAEAEEGQAVLRVRDSGVGISPDMLPRVFDLFTQGDQDLGRAQGGLGVGLNMVRSLVDLHGGSVEAHSEGEGRGAEFIVRLPLVGGKQAEPGEPEHPVEQRAVARRVLVVDDTKDGADTLAELVASWGHPVRVAYDGTSALRIAAEFRPEVVILDIGMPGMDGYEVARRLREQGAEPFTLLAVTGYARDEDRRRAREAGFAHHLSKPVDFNRLRELIARPG